MAVMFLLCLLCACTPGAEGNVAKYELEAYDSEANTSAIVEQGPLRVTVLSPRLFRIELAGEGGKFEDRASLAFVNRKLPVPEYTSGVVGGTLFVNTSDLVLEYTVSAGAELTCDALRVSPASPKSTAFGGWCFGMDSSNDAGNLFGTFRTLDQNAVVPLNCTGNKQPHCEFGLVSRSGWALVNDTGVPVLDKEDFWADASGKMLRNADKLDLYLFAHGRDYKGALADYAQVGGRIPIIPRYSSGVWWTRWFNLGMPDIRKVVETYESRGIPLDVFVLDMDWHTKNDWTGYSWDANVLPQPRDALAYLREQKGLATALNLHDASGVNSWETQWLAFAKAMKIDPSNATKIDFDLSSSAYCDNLEDEVLQPLEKDGVDFWWIDWQQGESKGNTGQDGPRQKMNPTIWLDKMRVTDSLRRCKKNKDCTNKRGVVLARFGGLGNHRYQHGFSGDVKGLTWENLAYQPYFTATASNVGFGFWSHDIEGPGNEPEMYVRWIQWAALSAVFRSHDRGSSAGGCDAFPEQAPPNLGCSIVEPWNVPEKFFEPIRAALRARTELIPYLYTLSRDAFDTGLSPLRPCYYEWPEEEMAYASNENGSFPQFMLGEDLLVRPVVVPADNDTSLARDQETWVPPGEWILRDSGRLLSGPAVDKRDYDLSETPVLVRAGAVIPGIPIHPGDTTGLARRQYASLSFTVYPGASKGSSRVYEDDGASYDYLSGKGASAWTTFSYVRDKNGINVTIETDGTFDELPRCRDNIIVRIEASPPVSTASVSAPDNSNSKPVSLPRTRWGGIASVTYDGPGFAAVVETGPACTSKGPVNVYLEYGIRDKSGARQYGGMKGIVKKANRAKKNLDLVRLTPGAHAVETSYVSRLAATGEVLSYLAANGSFDEFQDQVNAVPETLSAAYAQLKNLTKVDTRRLAYSLALLQSEMA